MNTTIKILSLLLVLLTALGVLVSCGSNSNTEAPSSPSAPTENSTPASNVQNSNPSPAPSPSESLKESSTEEEKLPINKENAFEKLLSGYNATMGLSSARLSGTVSQYTAGSGKGDTVSYPISFACTKEGGVFKATLTYGGSAADTERYFEGTKAYTKTTDKENGTVTVTSTEADAEYSVSTTVMPLLSESLTITSYENTFRRFCDTDFDVDFKDGVYTLYFYGSYTEIARICLEDEAYESFVKRNVEEQFSTSATLEFSLTEDGFFKGMHNEVSLESADKSMKSTLTYAFLDFGGAVTVEKPDFAAES